LEYCMYVFFGGGGQKTARELVLLIENFSKDRFAFCEVQLFKKDL